MYTPLVAFIYAQDNISDAEQILSDLPDEILTKLIKYICYCLRYRSI